MYLIFNHLNKTLKEKKKRSVLSIWSNGFGFKLKILNYMNLDECLHILIGLIKIKGTVLVQFFFHRNLQLIFKLFLITRLPLKAVNNNTKFERETRKINKATGTLHKQP